MLIFSKLHNGIIKNLVAVYLAGALLFIPSICHAAAAQTSNPAVLQNIHIELTVVPPSDHPRHLSRGNFVVIQGAQRFPVRVSRQAFPTHLLVIFPAETQRPAAATFIMEMNRFFAKGWFISVSRPDGTLTPYCSNPKDLAVALAATGSLFPLAASEIERLAEFPGRRVLLVVENSGLNARAHATDTIQEWPSLARKLRVPVYAVDGGLAPRHQVCYPPLVNVNVTPPYNLSGPPPNDSNEFSQHCVYVIDPAEDQYMHGIMHERKFDDAMRDVLRDARNNYDLYFSIPKSQLKISGPITLKLRHADLMSLRVSMYSMAMLQSDGTLTATRIHVPQKLFVKQSRQSF